MSLQSKVVCYCPPGYNMADPKRRELRLQARLIGIIFISYSLSDT